jgi:hypothetical protein
VLSRNAKRKVKYIVDRPIPRREPVRRIPYGARQVPPARPASHGCIRLSIEQAKRFYDWVEPGTPIVVWGRWPGQLTEQGKGVREVAPGGGETDDKLGRKARTGRSRRVAG